MTEEKNNPGNDLGTKKAIDQTKKDLEDLLKENIALSQDILKYSKKINNYVIWQQVFSVIKLLLIVVPIVLGIIYLPPLLESAFEPYRELLDISGGLENTGLGEYLKK